jgi:DNA polymerase III delta subunit
LPSLVLINGEEEFLKERAARDEARSFLAESVYEYRAPDGVPAYLDEVAMNPLFGGRRAFIVWGAEEVPPTPSGDDVLIAVSAPRKKLRSADANRVHDFPKLKAYDDNNEVVGWIMKEGARLNIDLSRVAGALFVNCGRSLRKISSEIRKLAILSPSGSVTPQDARSVICFSADLTPQSVVDSVCGGNPALALAFLDKLQEGGDETGWVIAFMQRHLLRQLHMEILDAAGVPPEDAARRLGVHPYVYRKTAESRLGLWSRASLFSSVEAFRGLDAAHKRGSGSARLGLELEIVRLSEEARDARSCR